MFEPSHIYVHYIVPYRVMMKPADEVFKLDGPPVVRKSVTEKASSPSIAMQLADLNNPGWVAIAAEKI